MSKRDAIQTAINQASLRMNVAEDIAKACKAAEIHPLLAQVLMNMHTTQVQQEEDIKQLRTLLFELGQVSATGADLTASTYTALHKMMERLNMNAEEFFKPEESGPTPS